MSITPADIEAQTFPMALRGYQVAAVDAFLDRLATELDHPAAAPSAPDPPGRGAPEEPDHLPADDGGPTARALRTLVHAEQMAEQVLAEARAEAAQVRAGAEMEAADLLAAARADTARMEAELRVRQQRETGALVAQVQQLRAEIDRLGRLERGYREALQVLLDEQQQALDERPPGLDPVPAAAPATDGVRPAA